MDVRAQRPSKEIIAEIMTEAKPDRMISLIEELNVTLEREEQEKQDAKVGQNASSAA